MLPHTPQCGDSPYDKECVTQSGSSARGEHMGCWGQGRGWGLRSCCPQHFPGTQGKTQRRALAQGPQATPLPFPQ